MVSCSSHILCGVAPRAEHIADTEFGSKRDLKQKKLRAPKSAPYILFKSYFGLKAAFPQLNERNKGCSKIKEHYFKSILNSVYGSLSFCSTQELHCSSTKARVHRESTTMNSSIYIYQGNNDPLPLVALRWLVLRQVMPIICLSFRKRDMHSAVS